MHTSGGVGSGLHQTIGNAGTELPHGLEQAERAFLACATGMQEALECAPGWAFGGLTITTFQAGNQAIAFAAQAREAGLTTTFLRRGQGLARNGVEYGI